MPETPLLAIRDVHAGYDGTRILNGLSMAVAEGEIVALLGSNGVGKTTLNKVLSGVVRCTAGTITFAGLDLASASAVEIVDAGLIHVPEGRKIFADMSVRDNLELGSYRRGKASRKANLERVFEIFPRLKERIRQLAGTLSGGEQQMLAIGRGLMAEPRLLILDEPSLGLSPLLVEELFSLIESLHDAGLTILLVEQNVAQSLDIADHAHVLAEGRIVLSGTGREMADNPELQKTYLGL